MRKPKKGFPPEWQTMAQQLDSAQSEVQGRPTSTEAGALARPDREAEKQNKGTLNTVDILGPDGTHHPAPVHIEQASKQHLPPIGTAEMLNDETIILHLRAESTDRKTHGDGELIVHTGDKMYGAIRQHIGDIHEGEIKFVSPWEDANGRPTNDSSSKSGLIKGDLEPQSGTAGSGSSANPGASGSKAPDGAAAAAAANSSNAPDAAAAAAAAAAVVVSDPIVPASQAFDDDVNNTYKAMSAETRAIVTRSGAAVVPVHHLTDAMPELRNQAPRGWPIGATWDSVDGCWSSGKNEIIVAEERRLISNGKWVQSGRAKEVLRHETGHAVDFTIKTMSDHTDFEQAYDADLLAMPTADKNQLAYFMQQGAAGRQETAAEGIADREGGATGGQTFHKDFPLTLKVINDTINGSSNGTGTSSISGKGTGPVAPGPVKH